MKFSVIGIAIIVLSLSLVTVGSRSVTAQDSPDGIASYITVTDKNVQDGSIVSSSNNAFSLTTKAYDPFIAGIVALRPAILFDLKTVPPNTYPLITTGQAFVLVSGQNGSIKKGDLITSSTTKGIGMKATKGGYVLGYALESYAPKKSSDIKKVAINIKIYFYATQPSVTSNLTDIFNLSAIAATEEPLRVLKYVLAALVLILAIILGFVSFARMASRGIEALGRNPLASRIIQLSMILNIAITLAIIAAGVIVALFIVRL